MAIDLDFKIETTECCDEVIFTDTTCSFDASKPALCCDGYGANGNPDKTDISYTRFNWATPDNVAYTNVDLGFVPNVGARVLFTIDSGTTGVLVVCIGGKQIGKAVFVDTLVLLTQSLVDNINSLTDETGWYAKITNEVTNEITIINTCRGIEYNGLLLNVFINGDIFVTIPTELTAGGDDKEDSISITMLNFLKPECASFNTLPPFQDGVHRIDYFIYDFNNEEVARKTKYVLIDCQVLSMLRALTRLLLSNDCNCNKTGLSKKTLLFKARYEAIKISFCEGDYKCANREVKELLEDMQNVCLDCD
jgi:hypothetical protein